MLKIASAVVLAGGVLFSAAEQEPTSAAVARQDRLTVRDLTVGDDVRRAYAEYWKSLPEQKATALDRRLQELERRAGRGESVQEDLQRLRKQEPELGRLHKEVLKWSRKSGLGTGSSGTDASTVECSGMGWIDRNGQPACAGKYIVRKIVGRPK